jgi:hypothetical protein
VSLASQMPSRRLQVSLLLVGAPVASMAGIAPCQWNPGTATVTEQWRCAQRTDNWCHRACTVTVLPAPAIVLMHAAVASSTGAQPLSEGRRSAPGAGQARLGGQDAGHACCAFCYHRSSPRSRLGDMVPPWVAALHCPNAQWPVPLDRAHPSPREPACPCGSTRLLCCLLAI